MFGAKQGTTSFSFGTPASTSAPAPLFGGATSTVAKPSLFGATTTSTGATGPSTGLFGAAPTTSTVPSLFGPTTTTGGLFGKPATSTGFGTAAPSFGAKPFFGAPATAAPSSGGQSIHALIQNSESLVSSVTRVELYGDERDRLLTRLNQLAAATGVGGGLYKKDVQAVPYSNTLPFYRFKAVGYNRVSTHRDEDGLVSLEVRAPASSLSTSAQKQALVDALFKVLESKPELKAHIHLVQSLPDNKMKVVVFVTQQGLGRVKASQLSAFFNQPNKKAELENALKVEKEKIAPLVAFDSTERRMYLKQTPLGFDDIIWRDAIKENPQPEQLIPHPIRGFEELRMRQRMHTAEVETQHSILDDMEGRATRVQSEMAVAKSRLVDLRTREKQLSHRLLRVLAMEMLTQRFALGIDQNEEQMQAALERMNVRLNAPNQLKDTLSMLKQEVREVAEKSGGEREAEEGGGGVRDKPLSEVDAAQLKRYLARCQDGLEQLVSIVNANQRDLRLMQASMGSLM